MPTSEIKYSKSAISQYYIIDKITKIWYNTPTKTLGGEYCIMNTKLLKKKINDEKWRIFTDIDGKKCQEEQRVGYCWSEMHRGYLTLPLMREHQCIEKGCKHFQKYEQAPHWRIKEKRRAQRKQTQAQEKEKQQKLQSILNTIRALTKEDQDFFAISVEEGTGLYRHQYIVRFIKFGWVDINYYVKLLKQRCNVSIYLQEIKNTHENKMQILKAQKLI